MAFLFFPPLPPSFFSIFRFKFLSPGIMLVSTVWEIFISVCLRSNIIMEIIFWFFQIIFWYFQASWVKYLFEFHSVCWSIQILYVQRSGHNPDASGIVPYMWAPFLWSSQFWTHLESGSMYDSMYICTHTLPMSGGGSLFKCCFRLMPSSCFLQFAWTGWLVLSVLVLSYSCNLIKRANSSNLGVGSLESCWIWCAN